MRCSLTNLKHNPLHHLFNRTPWLSTYLLVLVSLLVWGIIAYPLTPVEDQYLTLPEGENPSLVMRLTEPWRHWDTRHYLNIAENWYNPGGPELTWPPMYSILIGLFGRLLRGNYLLAALLISWSSLIIVCILLVKTFQDYTDKPTAQRAVKYLLLFPTAFFLFAGYSETLFLLFLLLSWRGAKKEIWWQAGLFGLLASMTRLAGAYLLVAYAWMWLKATHSQKLRIAAYLIPIPLTLIGWFFFTQKYYGLNPSDAVFKFWHLHPDWPWVGIINGLKYLITNIPIKSYHFFIFQDLLATFLFLWAIFWVAKRKWWPEAIFMATTLFMSLTMVMDTGELSMTGRYVLVLFPGFLLLAEWGKHRWFDRLWSGFSFLWMLFMSTFFFVG